MFRLVNALIDMPSWVCETRRKRASLVYINRNRLPANSVSAFVKSEWSCCVLFKCYNVLHVFLHRLYRCWWKNDSATCSLTEIGPFGNPFGTLRVGWCCWVMLLCPIFRNPTCGLVIVSMFFLDVESYWLVQHMIAAVRFRRCFWCPELMQQCEVDFWGVWINHWIILDMEKHEKRTTCQDVKM